MSGRLSFSDRGVCVAIAAFVFVVYAGVFAWSLGAAHAHGVSAETLLATGDAHDYVSLARTMLDTQRFALTPESPPEFFRVPGYPVFVAAVLALTQSLIALIVVQIFFVAATCALIYLLGVRFFSRGVGVAAALIFAVDPTVLLHSLTALSESFFVFLLVLCVYLLSAKAEKDDAPVSRALLIGALIGAISLTRPVGQFLVPLVLAYYLWTHRQKGRTAVIGGVIALLVAFMAVAGPWLIRNERLSGNFAFTSASTYNMLFYNVVEFEAEVMGVPKDEFKEYLYSVFGTHDTTVLRSFRYKEQEAALIREYIGPHLFSYAVYHVEKTIPFFIGSSIADTERELINMRLIDTPQTPAVSLSGLAISGDISAMFAILAAHPFTTSERVFWLLVCLFAAGYVLRALIRREGIPEALLFSALVGVLAVLVGVIAYTRYRIPAEPFLLLLAFEGVRRLFRWKNPLRSFVRDKNAPERRG